MLTSRDIRQSIEEEEKERPITMLGKIWSFRTRI